MLGVRGIKALSFMKNVNFKIVKKKEEAEEVEYAVYWLSIVMIIIWITKLFLQDNKSF